VTIFGWDMSHYDAPSIGTAIGEGIAFITHKAGGDALDTELAAWWSGVRGLPESVVLGAYWVLYPGSPAAKADAFLSRLDVECPGWRDRDAFLVQIDAEKWNNDPATKPGIAECNAFADRIVFVTGGKYTPVGYLPEWVYGTVKGFRYPIWASSYVGGSGRFKALYPGDSSIHWASYGKPVSILQYSSSATIGGQSTSDANAFRGTLEQLKALVTPGDNMDETSIAQAVASKLNGDFNNPATGLGKFFTAYRSGIVADVTKALNLMQAALAAAVAAVGVELTPDQLTALSAELAGQLGGPLSAKLDGISGRLIDAGTALSQ